MTLSDAAVKVLMVATDARFLTAAFENCGLSLDDVATGTGADLETVRAWREGVDQPHAGAYSRLDTLRLVVIVLGDSLTGEGIVQWLYAGNRFLQGKRPLDALREGQKYAVIQAATSFTDGSYV